MMFNHNFYTTLLLLLSCLGCLSLPINEREIKGFPLAYNLHQDFTPKDINDLGKEQRNQAIRDVKTTISEVQRLLALDPNLPRLTK